MNQPLITVVGSLNMDLVVAVDRAPNLGETLAGREFRTIPGGKGSNQAIAAARAGARCAMIGAVGQDSFGDQLLATLQADGVDRSHVRRVPGASGTAHILVDRAGQNSIVIVPGANGSMTELTEADRGLIGRSQFLLLQLELPLPVVVEAARVARQAGVTVILTPAPAQPLPRDLLATVDWLIPNEHEAALLAGVADPDAAAAILHEQVPNLVITLGAAGALLRQRGEAPLLIPAPRVTAVDTTAAGDTFTGTLAVALSEGQAPAAAVRWANGAAAISVTRFGASPAMPHRDEIDQGVQP